MDKRKVLIVAAGIVVTVILVGVLLYFALNQDQKPNIDPTGGAQTTEAPTEESTAPPTEPEPVDEDVPETSNSLTVSAFDGEKGAAYLEKYGLLTYESPFATIDAINGLQFVDIGDGVEIYRLGQFCGWFAAWDFSGVSNLSEDKVINDANIDAYIEHQFGGAKSAGIRRTKAEELADGVVRYDYEVKALVQKGDDWLVTNGIYDSEKEMLARGTYTLNVSAYCRENSNYGYILCTEDSVLDSTQTKKLAEAISFWKISFREERTTLETGRSAQEMYAAVEQNLPAVAGYLEMCKWFKEYNGEKLHRIPGTSDDNYSPATCPDIIFYRPEAGESLEDIVRAMFKEIMEPLTEASAVRPFTVTRYTLAQQEIQNYEGRQNTWLLPYLNGYYAYEGVDVVSMETAKAGSTIREGMVEFFRQGSDEIFQFVLVKEGNVYRLQRAVDMGLDVKSKEK